MTEHIELVNTEQGFHVRKRAANGEIIWSTEVYENRSHAEDVAQSEAMLIGQSDYEYVHES